MNVAPRSESRRRAERGAFHLFALHLWTVFGLALSNALMVLAAPLAGLGVRWRELPWRDWRPLLLPLGAYVTWLLVATAGSSDPVTSLTGARELLGLGTLFFALVLLRDEDRVERVVTGLIVVGVAMAVYGLAQFLQGYGDLGNRITGPFSHYMTFAGVLLCIDLLLLARMFCAQRRTAWQWTALVLVNAALIGTLTRSAWVALALTLGLLLVLRTRRFVLLYVPALVLAVLLAPQPLRQRALSIFDITDPSNFDRLCMVEAGGRMIAESPLVGIGPNRVSLEYARFRSPEAPRPAVTHLHNHYVQIAAEAGLPALAAYLWLMGVAAWRGFRRYREEAGDGGSRAGLLLGAVLVLVAFNIAGLFEDSWGDTEVQRMALLAVALPFALERKR